MTTLAAFTLVVGLVGVERLVELIVSNRHTSWSLEHGGREYGRNHYPVMVALHSGLLVGALVEAWLVRPVVSPVLAWSMLVLVVLAQALRWWCIRTLGTQWSTRVIVVPGLTPVRRGPYGFMDHPNYLAVVIEGFALPMIHAAWITALVFTVANAALLTVRIRVENAALADLTTGLTHA